jgi:hypothetical protein
MVTESPHPTTVGGVPIHPLTLSATEMIPYLVRAIQELKEEKDKEISTLRAMLSK